LYLYLLFTNAHCYLTTCPALYPTGKNDNTSLITRIKTKFKPREVAYTGRKIRIVPASPFLQLSRVHAVNEVQSAIPRVAPPPLYRQALVPLPLAVQQQMQQAKLVNNSLLNKPDVPDAELEEQEERAPVLFLENGTYHAVRVRACCVVVRC
jgi:hypothetical protein